MSQAGLLAMHHALPVKGDPTGRRNLKAFRGASLLFSAGDSKGK
jgi:hypothetical protein